RAVGRFRAARGVRRTGEEPGHHREFQPRASGRLAPPDERRRIQCLARRRDRRNSRGLRGLGMGERWQAVDNYIADTLLGADDALAAALANNAKQGLPPIDVSPAQGKMLFLLAQI